MWQCRILSQNLKSNHDDDDDDGNDDDDDNDDDGEYEGWVDGYLLVTEPAGTSSSPCLFVWAEGYTGPRLPVIHCISVFVFPYFNLCLKSTLSVETLPSEPFRKRSYWIQSNKMTPWEMIPFSNPPESILCLISYWGRVHSTNYKLAKQKPGSIRVQKVWEGCTAQTVNLQNKSQVGFESKKFGPKS